jgi:hypothetical protein
MVLLEIDTAGSAIFEFKGDAPRSVDMDRITLRIESMQRMKVEAGNVHFVSPDGDIDLRTFALRPQLRKGFAPERSDHPVNVSK